MKATITKYNASLSSLQDWVETLPQELQFDQAKDPESVLYCHFNRRPSNNDIPFAIKRTAIDLHNFLERCKEEQKLLLLEVERLFNHYFGEKEKLETYIAQHPGDHSRLMRGINVLIKKKLCEINNMLYWSGSILLDYLSTETISKLPNSKTESGHMGSSEFSAVEFAEITYNNETNEDEQILLDFSDDDSDCDDE